ncbi:MAG: ABC transporter ATP-binding protein [bacterium]
MSVDDYREEEKLGKGYDAALMKRLLTYLYPYKWQLGGAALLLLAGSGLMLAGPYLLKIAIDNYIRPISLIKETATAFGGHTALFGMPHLGSIIIEAMKQSAAHGLRSIALIYLLVLVLQFGVGYGQFYVMQWIGQKAMYDLRREIFIHVQTMHLGFYDKNPTGRLLTRITNDVNALNELFASGAVAIFGNLAQVVGIVAMMFYLSVKLSLVAFIILPLLLGATLVFRKRARDSYRQVRLILARLNSYVQDKLAGISEVQYFVQERKVFDQFNKVNSDLRAAHHRSVLYYAVFFPAVEIIGAVSLALIIWYGGGLHLQKLVTLGTLVAFFQYMESFYHPLRDLAEKYNILQAAMAASERVFKLLDSEPEVIAPELPETPQKNEGRVEFENVNFAYNAQDWVLRDINLKIEPGEKVALVGATGAGKSSLVSLICRFYDYQEGTLRFDGIDVKRLDPEKVREQIGLVLQDVFLFSGTIAENITLNAEDIAPERVQAAATQVGLMPLIRRLADGLNHRVGERGTLLSVGERQLVSFARALAHDPRVIILDEATSSVDNQTEQIIQQALKHLFTGRTAVIVAHRLSTIKEADKILVFHRGRIVEAGKHDELLAKQGFYWRLYQLQYQDQEAV